jgi:ribosomal protein S15P/S13E
MNAEQLERKQREMEVQMIELTKRIVSLENTALDSATFAAIAETDQELANRIGTLEQSDKLGASILEKLTARIDKLEKYIRNTKPQRGSKEQ